MSTIGVILLVAFVIVCVLLVLLVLVQDDGQNGMGGLMGGRGTQAFGSHSANVLTKTTLVLVVLFFVLALGLAMINRVKDKGTDDLESKDAQAVEQTTDAETAPATDWVDEALKTQE